MMFFLNVKINCKDYYDSSFVEDILAKAELIMAEAIAKEDVIFKTNFNILKINSLFKNLSSLNFYQLYQLKKDYLNINYSFEEIDIHIKKLVSFPIYLTIMSILSSIIMLNIKRNNSQIVYLLIGIFSSVTIYYINVLSQTLGKNGTIPLNLSIWMPIIILSIIIMIGLVRINEK